MIIKHKNNKNNLSFGNYVGWNNLGLSMSAKKANSLKYFANDNYYKLITGHTLTELIAGTDDGSVLESTVGRGATFRSILNTAINKEAATRQKSGGNNTSQAYTSMWAPELQISSSTGDFHPVDQSQFNSVRATNGSETVEVTSAEWKDILTKVTDPLLQLKAPAAKFVKLQAMMKNILDDAKIAAGTKVSFEIPIGNMTPFYNMEEYKTTMDRIMKVWRMLDPRINPVYQVTPVVGGPIMHVSKPSPSQHVAGESKWTNYVLPRLLDASPIGSLTGTGKLTNSSVANVLLDNANDLGNGMFTWLSYFSDASLTSTMNSLYAPISKLTIPLKTIFVDHFKNDISDIETKLHSTIKSKIISSISGFNFDDVHKSSVLKMSEYDYAGLKPFSSWFDKFKDAKDTEESTRSADQKLIISDYSVLSTYISKTFRVSAYFGKAEEEKLSKDELIKGMSAFDRLVSNSANPLLNSSIGNRAHPSLAITKSWIKPVQNIRDGGHGFIDELLID